MKGRGKILIEGKEEEERYVKDCGKKGRVFVGVVVTFGQGYVLFGGDGPRGSIEGCIGKMEKGKKKTFKECKN